MVAMHRTIINRSTKLKNVATVAARDCSKLNFIEAASAISIKAQSARAETPWSHEYESSVFVVTIAVVMPYLASTYGSSTPSPPSHLNSGELRAPDIAAITTG